MRRHTRPCLVLLLLTGLVHVRPGTVGAQQPDNDRLDRETTTAVAAARRGDFTTAAAVWKRVAERQRLSGQRRGYVDALQALADAYQSQGDYQQAEAALIRARQELAQMGDQAGLATVLASLGNLYITLRQPTDAEALLNESLSLGRASDLVGLEAATRNSLGNLLAMRGESGRAIEEYAASAMMASRSGSVAVETRAWMNHARVTAGLARNNRDSRAQAEASLERALRLNASLPDSHEKAYNLVGIGHTWLDLARADSTPTTTARVGPPLEAAAALAAALDDPLAESYAYGYLGTWREREGDGDQALRHTRQALLLGMRAQAQYGTFGSVTGREGTGTASAVGYAMYQWEWQAARLLAARQELDASIAAARRAVGLIEDMRFDMSTGYATGRESFRERVQPVYSFLVERLFEKAEQAPASARVELLAEARRRIESLKAAELRDYFGDDCLDTLLAAEREATKVDPRAVVLYPILLDDRLELLVDAAGESGLRRVRVPVSRRQISETIVAFRRAIDERGDVFATGGQLYDWLIRPLQLNLSQVSTFVFVPDGPLRLVPLAALFDTAARQYLIEQVPLASIPALNLVDPQPLPGQRTSLRLLLAGLSEGSPGSPALPKVDEELSVLRQLFPNSMVLRNEGFTEERLASALTGQNFAVVHVASHGRFTGTAESAYLETHGGKPLSITTLAKDISALRFRGLDSGGNATTPLELLVLSACETATGDERDERAALGLAGVAISAGARSAVGTLWQVDDGAAARLIHAFYNNLRQPNMSKARALQAAQRELAAENTSFEHPVFWAAFLLISNWL